MKNALLGSGQDLMQQARRLGIPGRSDMSVGELREAVGKAVASTAAPRGGAAVKMRREMAAQEAPAVESVEPEMVSPEAAVPEQDFDAQLAELQALLAEAGQSQAQEAPQAMPAPPAYSMPQNRLLGR